MKYRVPIVHHPAYCAEIPDDHRFPMLKFKRLAEIIYEDGLLGEENFHTPSAATEGELCLAHDPRYVSQVLSGSVPKEIERAIGLPMSQSVGLRGAYATGGSILTGQLAVQYGIACNTAGGSHHASYHHGAGFSVFNDVAVAIRVLQSKGLIKTALVIDVDVHQGDGTAQIFQNDRSVFTLSLHCDANYPFEKQYSDWDVEFAAGTANVAYLDRLAHVLDELEKARKPDIVFYNAGVDPHVEDRLGKLALSDEALFARDELVLSRARRAGVPLAAVIGGGYMKDIDAVARRHSIIHRAALNVWSV